MEVKINISNYIVLFKIICFNIQIIIINFVFGMFLIIFMRSNFCHIIFVVRFFIFNFCNYRKLWIIFLNFLHNVNLFVQYSCYIPLIHFWLFSTCSCCFLIIVLIFVIVRFMIRILSKLVIRSRINGQKFPVI